jgi:hypothetical protein
MPTEAGDKSSAQPIARPGRKVDATLAELLNIDENSEVVAEWRARMRDIEASERSAENDEASVRIR